MRRAASTKETDCRVLLHCKQNSRARGPQDPHAMGICPGWGGTRVHQSQGAPGPATGFVIQGLQSSGARWHKGDRLGFRGICQKCPTSPHLCQGYFCTKHQVHFQTVQGWSAQTSFDGRRIACGWLVTQSSLWFGGEAPYKQLRLWTASQLLIH